MVVWFHEIYGNIYLHFPPGECAIVETNGHSEKSGKWPEIYVKVQGQFFLGDGGCKPSEKDGIIFPKKEVKRKHWWTRLELEIGISIRYTQYNQTGSYGLYTLHPHHPHQHRRPHQRVVLNSKNRQTKNTDNTAFQISDPTAPVQKISNKNTPSKPWAPKRLQLTFRNRSKLLFQPSLLGQLWT